MSPDVELVHLAIFAGLCVLLAVGLVAVAALVRYRAARPAPGRADTYECGEPPQGDAWAAFPVGFYLLALLFILFDVEAAFLFLWVRSLHELGPAAFWAMVAFLAVLLLGWWAALRRRDLEWLR